MTTAQDQQIRAELLPCPFCGKNAHFEHDADGWQWVECESCGMESNRRASLMEDCRPLLAKAWNRRAPTEQAARKESQQQLEDCKAELAKLERYRFAMSQGHLLPPGWQAVPVEPTQEMIDAMPPAEEIGYWAMYSAALAAAPRPPAAQEVPSAVLDAIRAAGMQLLKGAAGFTLEKAVTGIAQPAALTTCGAADTMYGAGGAISGPRPAMSGAELQLVTGPCGQCKDDRQPCSCAIDTMLSERGSVAVNRERYLAMARQAKAAQERKPLTDERIQEIDDETHFHESPDWPRRFARAIEAEAKKKTGP